MNLGLLYEDRDDFLRLSSVTEEFSMASRLMHRSRRSYFPCKAFLKDSAASGDRQLDEQEQRQRDRLEQVLALPVSDFELSVRSRNCLAKWASKHWATSRRLVKRMY